MTPAHATAVAQVASAAVKLAEAAKARMAAAPKPADPTLVAKAAQALVDTGFVEPTLQKEAADKLSTLAGALELVHDLSVKAAEEIARLSGTGNPRLAAGEPVGADPFKQAADRGPHSDADADFVARMNAYRQQ